MKRPQFYRQRFLLGFIQSFYTPLSKTDFMKYLFLALEKQEKKLYYFTPYQYGPFSFQAYADLNRLAELKYITFTDNISILGYEEYRNLLNTNDLNIIDNAVINYFNLSGDDLVRFVYEKYPFYAINSLIRNRILGENFLIDLPTADQVFTIGYEGITIDKYLQTLVKKNIKSVIDVRKNPISMKYGFSKKTLENALIKLNISYLHLPKLGIDSEERQNLNTYNDYTNLFEIYEKTTLSKAQNEIDQIYHELKNSKRVALTCFESNPLYCHRMRITSKITQLYGCLAEHI